MAEEYFYYMAGSELKPGVCAKNTYNGDVTEQDLRCWALSAKTCAVANTRAVKSNIYSNQLSKNMILGNKRFGIFTTESEHYPSELAINSSVFPDPGSWKMNQIDCVHKPGEFHTLVGSSFEQEPLCVSCPSCWSSLRTVGKPMLAMSKKLKKKRKKKRANKRLQVHVKKRRHSLTQSAKKQTVRSIRKAAVHQSKTTPRKHDLNRKKAAILVASDKAGPSSNKDVTVPSNGGDDNLCIGDVSEDFEVDVQLSPLVSDVKGVCTTACGKGAEQCPSEGSSVQSADSEINAALCTLISDSRPAGSRFENQQQSEKPKYTLRGRILKRKRRDF